MFEDITTPTLLLDEKKCRANLQRMAEKARQQGLRLRPHLKTPQSLEIAGWMRELGIQAITVSSFAMAEYFADGGWRDITVAFPVNIREMARINRLAGKVSLNVVVENREGIAALQTHLGHPARVWIKADIGNQRTGLLPSQHEVITSLLRPLSSASKLQFAGFLGHAGQSYRARGAAAIHQVHGESLAQMQQLRHRYQKDFPELEISVGDTPTASLMNHFPGVDELRPGNFFFYDLMQWQIGACTAGDIAVALACPVVSRHPERKEIVLYGGAIHFSKDHLTFSDGTPYFGMAANWQEGQWELAKPPAYLRGLSQEHGILRAESEWLARTPIGSLVLVLPVHSCLTADLMKNYQTLDGKKISMMPLAD